MQRAEAPRCLPPHFATLSPTRLCVCATGGSRAPEATTVGIRLEVTGLALLEPALATLLAPRAGPPVAAPAPARGEAPAAAPGSAAAAPGSGPATPAAPRGAGRPGAPAQKDPAAAAGGLSGAAAAAPPARAGREPDPGPEPGLSPGPGAPWRCCVEVAGPGSELAASLPLLVGAAAAAAPEPGKGEAARGRAARAGGRDGSAKAAADRPPVRPTRPARIMKGVKGVKPASELRVHACNLSALRHDSFRHIHRVLHLACNSMSLALSRPSAGLCASATVGHSLCRAGVCARRGALQWQCPRATGCKVV